MVIWAFSGLLENSFRLRRKHRKGGQLRVGHNPENLWKTHFGQQCSQPVLLHPRRAHPAWAGVGGVATIERSKGFLRNITTGKDRARGRGHEKEDGNLKH